jgi:hypothetical protein
MNSKNKGLPANFAEDFKSLPLVQRIYVLFIARIFLWLQRGKKAPFEDGGDRSKGKEGGRK